MGALGTPVSREDALADVTIDGDPVRGLAMICVAVVGVLLVWGVAKLELWLRDEREKRIARRVAEELEEKKRAR